MHYDPTKYQHVFLHGWADGTDYHLTEICKHIAENETNTVIHILNLEESFVGNYSMWLHFNPEPASKYLDNLKRHNIRVEIYQGCSGKGYNERHGCMSVLQYNNHHITFEPTFFIKKAFEKYSSLNYINPSDSKDLDFYMKRLIEGSTTDQIDRLYMCLNGAPREHRINLLNQLKKKNLLDDGYISWHGPKNKWHIQPKRDKHNNWLNEIMKLPSQDFEDDDINHKQYHFPYEARHCVISLVAETDVDSFFLTEKTAIPLLIGKPVLVYSVRHFHKSLKDLGFVLHDDIIDYSFDNYPSQYRRMDGIINNLQRLKEEYKNNYYELYRKMYPVIAYNSQHVAYLSKKKYTAFNMLQFEDPNSKYSIPNLRAHERLGVPDIECLSKPSYRQKFRDFLPGEIDKKERFINYHGHFPIRLYEPNQ